ncbi:MAG: cytochrome c biogenesis protein ResB [Candidatus Nanopelagicales bacterium]|nr:cytochrome c biogenesis protein ResB [Candidatus Nanopelagicales bacterium]
MNPESLAQMSNVAIYSSMLTLAMAMVAFAASFASGKRRLVAVTAAATMSAGGTAVLTKSDAKPLQEPGVVKVPDSTPQLGIQGLFLPTAALDAVRGPYSSFPAPDDPAVFMSAWKGDLGLDSGAPQSVYRLVKDQMKQIGLKQLKLGQSWELPDGSGAVSFEGYERWASFQIASDPGKEIALFSAAAAIVGLTMSLFIRRRRVWVKVVLKDGDFVLQLAGIMSTSTFEDKDIGVLAEDLDLVEQALESAGQVHSPDASEK